MAHTWIWLDMAQAKSQAVVHDDADKKVTANSIASTPFHLMASS
jgi:hypothetical protein